MIATCFRFSEPRRKSLDPAVNSKVTKIKRKSMLQVLSCIQKSFDKRYKPGTFLKLRAFYVPINSFKPVLLSHCLVLPYQVPDVVPDVRCLPLPVQ